MQHNSLTLPPLTVLGLRADGRPIYNIAGGSAPAGEQAPPAVAPPAAPPVPTPPAPAAPPAAPPKASTFEWDGKVESLPADVKKLLDDARADAGKARVTAKEQAAKEARDELLKRLGLKPDGSEEVDPDKLAAQLASKDAQLLGLQRETAASKAARAAGADVDALLDRRSFVDDLNLLDPGADDFEAKLTGLVKKALEKDPKLKAAQAARVSGGQFTGGSGEGKQRPTSIGAALAAQAAKS